MIADKNLANPDAFPPGTAIERPPQRSYARKLISLLRYLDVQKVPTTPAQAEEVSKVADELSKSPSLRDRETGAALRLKILEHNRKMAELVSRAMVEEKQPVNVAVFVKVIKGVNEEML